MRETFAKCFVLIGVGLAAVGVQGCKNQAALAPVQPVVRTALRVQPDFPVGSLPVEDVITRRATPSRAAGPRTQVQPTPAPAQSTDVQAAALAAAQEQQDARLLQEQRDARLLQEQQDAQLLQAQQTESQRQQEELNQEIEQEMRWRQEVDSEQRIQDNPGQAAPVQPTQWR